ncbi:hypothetical protein JL720_15972 [Aureococcus anophagefferens]|nr:hypothetical protein JL720_15972 [Aureococcus anophagefferens]
MDGRIQPGDRVLGRYRTDEYRATVLAADGDDDDVVVEWAPPHNKWGPATLKRRDVRFVSRPKPEHPLSTLLPGRLEDGSGDLVELDAAYDACDAVGIFFASGDTPPRDGGRRRRQRDAPGGNGNAWAWPSSSSTRRRRPSAGTAPRSRATAIPCRRERRPRCRAFQPDGGLRARELPSLCVVDLASGRILTYDGMDALDELPEGFLGRVPVGADGENRAQGAGHDGLRLLRRRAARRRRRLPGRRVAELPAPGAPAEAP